MKRAAFLLLLAALTVPVPGFSEDITLFKHAYRKQAPPPQQTESASTRYRVKPGDTLRKIFLKDFGAKPEDLPALYRKFRQYNPGVRDLNRIIADYRVTIPGSPAVKPRAAASAAGTQVPSGNVVVIRKGQHLAKVLRQMYGLSDEAIFHQYLEKIRKLNPDIEDLNLLVEGQKVKLPAISPAPRGDRDLAQTPAGAQKPGAAVPGKPRRLKIVELDVPGPEADGAEKEPQKPAREVEEKASPGEVVRAPAGAAAAGQVKAGGNGEASLQAAAAAAVTAKAQEAKDAAAAQKARADEAREREAIEIVQGSLLPVFREMGYRQRDRGTYFLPVVGDKVVSIDAAEVPIIDLDGSRRVLVDVNNRIPPETKKLIEETYPGTRVLSGPAGGKEALLERLLDACGYFSVNRDAGPVLVGEDEKIRLFGKWVIYKDKSRRRVVVINVLSPGELATPEEIRNYASRFGIRLVEMGGKPAFGPKASQGPLRGLGQSYEKLFGIMGVAYEKDRELSLVSLDALKISYTAPLMIGKVVITPELPDRTMLEMLQKTGYRVVDAKRESLGDVLEALSLRKQGPPVRIVVAKGRVELDLPAVQVGDTTILERPVDKDIVKFLTSTGMKVMVW